MTLVEAICILISIQLCKQKEVNVFYIGDAKVVVVYLETSYNFYQVMDLLFEKYGSSVLVFDPDVPGTGQNEKQYADWFCEIVVSRMSSRTNVSAVTFDLVYNPLNVKYSSALVKEVIGPLVSRGVTTFFVTLDPLVVDAVESYSKKGDVAVVCYDCESGTYRNVTGETDKWVYKPVLDVVQKFEDAKNK